MKAGLEPHFPKRIFIKEVPVVTDAVAERNFRCVEHFGTIFKSLLHGDNQTFVAVFVSLQYPVTLVFPGKTDDFYRNFILVGKKFRLFVVYVILCA